MRPLIEPDEVRAWREHGFVEVRRAVVSTSELNELRALLIPLVTGWSSLPAGYAQDLGSGDARTPTLPEVTYASRLRPRLVRTAGFVQLRAPGSSEWRSYSFLQASGSIEALEFLIRILPEGVMSDYLAHAAKD